MTPKTKSPRSVSFNGIEIEYTLERKPVKNINLRIRTDGSVYVSANRHVRSEHIDAFVSSKGDYILHAQKKFAAVKKNEPSAKEYVSTERFIILGKELILSVLEGPQALVTADETHIYLVVPDICDFKRKEKLIKQYTDKKCLEVFSKIMLDLYPLFKTYLPAPPTLKIRDMTTRWGSCIPKKNTVTLNKRLLEKPQITIEYVALHEYCHFIQPNHSKNFYALMSSFMPDWKERKAALNS